MVKIIKICGVRDVALAREAVLAGATMIGLIAHPTSPRHVTVEQAVIIADVTRAAGGLPVAIFVNETADEMRFFCEVSQITCVQLHGAIAKSEHVHLPDYFQRIYAMPANHIVEPSPWPSPAGRGEYISHLEPQRDFILLDNHSPGQGCTFPLENIRYDLPFPLLLAGGLNASNVQQRLRLCPAQGVDVSSSVEVSPGNKDIRLIKNFIEIAMCHSERSEE